MQTGGWGYTGLIHAAPPDKRQESRAHKADYVMRPRVMAHTKAGRQSSSESGSTLLGRSSPSSLRSLRYLSDLPPKRARWISYLGSSSELSPSTQVGCFLICFATVQHRYVDESHPCAAPCPGFCSHSVSRRPLIPRHLCPPLTRPRAF